ncbi:unnamed protein product [Brugia timori]|uniref:Uncharacterized protein n=1 Tax=Brugia timori TaxID=42155 RepID=A0A0R3QTW8_9BILA|nr:unnamed protein product [Brugia timori]
MIFEVKYSAGFHQSDQRDHFSRFFSFGIGIFCLLVKVPPNLAKRTQ